MKNYLLLVLLIGLTNLNLLANNNSNEKDELFEKAVELSKKFIIVDTHIDVPYRLSHKWEDVSMQTEKGHFDYVRGIKGGLNAAFMSIYIPAEFEDKGGSVELADSLIDIVETLVKQNPEKFAIALSTEDVKNQFSEKLISLPMGMENGTPLQGNFENLKHFYDRGIRYLTLSHGKANHICDSSYDPNKKWNGLSPFGKTLIPEMNKLGIMVDISHVSDSTFYQVMEITKVPAIASHSSCRYFTPGFERNMNDDMIKKLAENGGVIQITFGSYFISGDYNKKSVEMENYIKEHHIKNGSEEERKYSENYKKEHPIDYGTVEDVADHIDHVVKLVGIDHVGLGSDFDGVGRLPENIQDVSYYPYIIYELLKKNYSEEDIQKVCSGNLLRVWKAVEDYAENGL
ncbi:MAG: membrane dipeptidase [Ignavibacteriales bacterium]|nr:membrane dipeptidase [Ignavibacteriales bacterium]